MASERKPFLLRLDPQLLRALQRWAEEDLRSLNGQLEFLLRGLLVKAGRIRDPNPPKIAAGGAAASPLPDVGPTGPPAAPAAS